MLVVRGTAAGRWGTFSDHTHPIGLDYREIGSDTQKPSQRDTKQRARTGPKQRVWSTSRGH